MMAKLIWNDDLHSVIMKKLIFSKGGTCSTISVEEAKVKHVPLFLLKAEVEFVPQDYKNCKIFTYYPSNEVNYISKFIKMKENLFLFPILCQKMTIFCFEKVAMVQQVPLYFF